MLSMGLTTGLYQHNMVWLLLVLFWVQMSVGGLKVLKHSKSDQKHPHFRLVKIVLGQHSIGSK